MTLQCSGALPPLARVERWHRLGLQSFDLGEAQADVDELAGHVIVEEVTARVCPQRAADRETAAVEVVQNEAAVDIQRQLVQQLARGRHRHALRTHQGDVPALLQLGRLQDLVKAFLLDEQNVAEPMFGAIRRKR